MPRNISCDVYSPHTFNRIYSSVNSISQLWYMSHYWIQCSVFVLGCFLFCFWFKSLQAETWNITEAVLYIYIYSQAYIYKHKYLIYTHKLLLSENADNKHIKGQDKNSKWSWKIGKSYEKLLRVWLTKTAKLQSYIRTADCTYMGWPYSYRFS